MLANLEAPMFRLMEKLEGGHGLPLFGDGPDVPRIRQRRDAQIFLKHILLNRFISEILDLIPHLGLRTWLTAGCLVQTSWNVQAGRRPYEGIDDYDLIYFDPDVSWEAEDVVIKKVDALFAHLPVYVQIRNQARVPLWYGQKFSIDYPPVKAAEHAVLRFPSRTTAIAITRLDDGDIGFYAPFGFRDALKQLVRPNFRLPLQNVYAKKAERWQREWPSLVVEPWERR